MFLTSVILILREVLEVALLTGILAALSDTLDISRRWILPSLSLGVLGSVVFSYFIGTISDWLDGVGQEVFSASLQLIVYLLFLVIAMATRRHLRMPGAPTVLITVAISFAVALSMTREGFEIIIYVLGYAGLFPQLTNVIMGAVIGAGIGISVSIVLYYLLRLPALRKSTAPELFLLAFFGAGLVLQATQLLIQADWLPAAQPLWDTSGWLQESSVSGQLLYALVGYEATPDVYQVSAYIFAFTLMLAAAVQVLRRRA